MKTKIIYFSTYCEKSVFQEIFTKSLKKSGNAIQKFHGLIVNGLARQNTNYVDVVSSIPVSHSTHKKLVWHFPSAKTNNIEYHYVPILNIFGLKNIFVFIYSYFYILFLRSNKKSFKIVLILDALTLSISLGALLSSRLRKIPCVSIVTDAPGLGIYSTGLFEKVKNKIINSIISRYDGYVFATKQMDSRFNIFNKPFMVMEGLVDYSMCDVKNELSKKHEEKIIMYAGGISERYGIKLLLEAFLLINDPLARLHIYGSGAKECNLHYFQELDIRVKFKGVVDNDIVVEEQLRATLLVNPRPTHEEFTEYSFPSKNLEYMVSGPPTVTTLLPGMPEENYNYVYILDDETVSGYYSVINDLINRPRNELHDFGARAKEFILNNKNNIIQTKKITDFINNV